MSGLRLLVAFTFALAWSLTTGHAADLPNVVVFLADDAGWGDLSVNGNSKPPRRTSIRWPATG